MSYASWEPLPVDISVLEGCIELIHPNPLFPFAKSCLNIIKKELNNLKNKVLKSLFH